MALTLLEEAERLQALAAQLRGDNNGPPDVTLTNPRFQRETQQAAATYELAAAVCLLANTNTNNP